jgi:competence protein ComEC
LSSLKFVAGGVACVALGFGVGCIWPKPTRLTFLSVGQGDCAVFQHAGATILIDSGPRNPKIDAGEKIVVPDLRQMGVDGVDLILLSHPDIDHVGGTGAILRTYPEATVAISACFRQNHQLLELLSRWGRDPKSVKWLGPEYKGVIGDFEIRIDCPQTDPDEETNDGSMIVRISDGAASAVFTGDAPAKIEQAFGSVANWRSEVMKAGHHGSRSATSEPWIQAVHPEYAILSCGLNNEYHHPHPEVVKRLKDDGVKICRTDEEGDIVFELKHGHFERE